MHRNSILLKHYCSSTDRLRDYEKQSIGEDQSTIDVATRSIFVSGSEAVVFIHGASEERVATEQVAAENRQRS